MPLAPGEARPTGSEGWVSCWACSQTGAMPLVTRAASKAVSAAGRALLAASGGGSAARSPFAEGRRGSGPGRNVSRALEGPFPSGSDGRPARTGSDGRCEGPSAEGTSSCEVRRTDVEVASGSVRLKRRTTRGPGSLRTRGREADGGDEAVDGSAPTSTCAASARGGPWSPTREAGSNGVPPGVSTGEKLGVGPAVSTRDTDGGNETAAPDVTGVGPTTGGERDAAVLNVTGPGTSAPGVEDETEAASPDMTGPGAPGGSEERGRSRTMCLPASRRPEVAGATGELLRTASRGGGGALADPTPVSAGAGREDSDAPVLAGDAGLRAPGAGGTASDEGDGVVASSTEEDAAGSRTPSCRAT